MTTEIVGMSQEAINALLMAKSRSNRGSQTATEFRLNQHNFDPRCLFLLDINFENLFDPHVRMNETRWSGLWFKCKGCGAIVKRTGRLSHHGWHKRELKGLTDNGTADIQEGQTTEDY